MVQVKPFFEYNIYLRDKKMPITTVVESNFGPFRSGLIKIRDWVQNGGIIRNFKEYHLSTLLYETSKSV